MKWIWRVMRNGGVSRMTQSYRIVQQCIKYPMDRIERKGGREQGGEYTRYFQELKAVVKQMSPQGN